MAKSAFPRSACANRSCAWNTARTASATGSSANPRPARRIPARCGSTTAACVSSMRATKTDIAIAVRSDLRDPNSKAAARCIAEGGGQWQARKFRMHGRAESPLALRETTRPYRIDVHATAGQHARRMRAAPCSIRLRLRGFDLKLALSGPNLAELYPLIGMAIPDSPPYRFDGRLTREVTSTSRTERARPATSGTTTISPGVSATATWAAMRVSKPAARARSCRRTSSRSAWTSTTSPASSASRAAGGRRRNRQRRSNAAGRAPKRRSARVLPDTPYELDKLRAMDADVRWKAQRINAPKLPIDDMDAHLLLDDGPAAPGAAELRRRRRRHPLDHPHGCARDRRSARAPTSPRAACNLREAVARRWSWRRTRSASIGGDIAHHRHAAIRSRDARHRRRRRRHRHGPRPDQQPADGIGRASTSPKR